MLCGGWGGSGTRKEPGDCCRTHGAALQPTMTPSRPFLLCLGNWRAAPGMQALESCTPVAAPHASGAEGAQWSRRRAQGHVSARSTATAPFPLPHRRNPRSPARIINGRNSVVRRPRCRYRYRARASSSIMPDKSIFPHRNRCARVLSRSFVATLAPVARRHRGK